MKSQAANYPTGCESKVAFIIRNVGDYHAPRLLQLQTDLLLMDGQMLTIEASSKSFFYTHGQERSQKLKKRLNLVKLGHPDCARTVFQLVRQLIKYRPSSIFVLGYNDELSLTALFIGKIIGSKIFFLSDSKGDDQTRSPAKEKLKSIILAQFDGAMVAGERHRKYFVSLGMAYSSIATGYDVIDNAYFAKKVRLYRARRHLLQKSEIVRTKYVLCVSRLVPRKRVDTAIKVFACSGLAELGYRLIIVGDGPEYETLERLNSRLGLRSAVLFCGSVKNSRMPLYYAFADAHLLTSEYDQWGLVVNEAMAGGVPSLVTQRCGCAGEILFDRVNGYVWDGNDCDQGGKMLASLVLNETQRREYIGAGKKIIDQWGVERFSSSARLLLSRSKAHNRYV